MGDIIQWRKLIERRIFSLCYEQFLFTQQMPGTHLKNSNRFTYECKSNEYRSEMKRVHIFHLFRLFILPFAFIVIVYTCHALWCWLISMFCHFILIVLFACFVNIECNKSRTWKFFQISFSEGSKFGKLNNNRIWMCLTLNWTLFAEWAFYTHLSSNCSCQAARMRGDRQQATSQ